VALAVQGVSQLWLQFDKRVPQVIEHEDEMVELFNHCIFYDLSSKGLQLIRHCNGFLHKHIDQFASGCRYCPAAAVKDGKKQIALVELFNGGQLAG